MSFIWGLILVLVNGLGFACWILDIINSKGNMYINYIAAFITLLGFISGAIRVHKAVN